MQTLQYMQVWMTLTQQKGVNLYSQRISAAGKNKMKGNYAFMEK